jgi:hypothetical protein
VVGLGFFFLSEIGLMTLVLNALVDGHPLLLGDVLLTSKGTEEEVPFSIPTFRSYPADVRQKLAVYIPRGLCQKLKRISKDMIVGWSAKRVGDAEDLLMEMASRYSARTPDVDELKTFLSGYGCQANDLSVTGILRNGREVFDFEENSWSLPTNAAGWRFCGVGSGCKEIDNLVKAQVETSSPSRPINKCEYLISLGLFTTAPATRLTRWTVLPTRNAREVVAVRSFVD